MAAAKARQAKQKKRTDVLVPVRLPEDVAAQIDELRVVKGRGQGRIWISMPRSAMVRELVLLGLASLKQKNAG